MTDVERPDDTWLREGGNTDVADYIAAMVAENERIKTTLSAEMKAHAHDVWEHTARHEQDIGEAVHAGFIMGWTADAGSECVNQAHAAVAHYRASRKGGSA